MQSPSHIYTRREPRNSVLYQTLAAHVDNYFAEFSSQAQHVPKFVEAEFEAFLKCGILYHGFVRVGCGECRSERLVALSCKKRGFCSSCAARRQAELTEYLVEKVFVDVPVRQFVLSIPFELRYWLTTDAGLTSKVYEIFSQEVEKHFRRASRAVRARGGSVTVIQRFSSDLSANVHYHLIAADGVFVPKTTGREKFKHASAITDGDVMVLVTAVAKRVIKQFVKKGYLTEEGPSPEPPPDKLFDEAPWLAENYKASVHYRIAHGPRAGQLVRKLGVQTKCEGADHADKGPRCAEVRGFSIHANSVGRDKDAIRRLVSYVSRPAIATERLKVTNDGELLYELKRAWKNGTTAVKLSPFEFIERLCALVPPPYANQTRWSGVYGPAARARSKVTLERKIKNRSSKEPPQHTKKLRISWASLLKKTFQIDLSKCRRCGAPTKILGTVFSQSAVVKILNHLNLECGPPSRGGGTNGWGPPLFESQSPPKQAFLEPIDAPFSDFGA